MLRPCQLWGQVFDVHQAPTKITKRDYRRTARYDSKTQSYLKDYYIQSNICVSHKHGYCESPSFEDTKEAPKFYREAFFTIESAMNAPVLATKAVLDGLPKRSQLSVDVLGDWRKVTLIDDVFSYTTLVLDGFTLIEKPVSISDFNRIKADDYDTLEYLLGFTLDGEPTKPEQKKEG